MIEIFILALIALKALGLVSIAWSLVVIISLAMIIVEIRLYQNKKALLASIVRVTELIDENLDDLEERVNSKKARSESGW